MAINMNGYVEPVIPLDFICNELPPARLIIAPKPRCILDKNHKGSHVASKGTTHIEWDFKHGKVEHDFGSYEEWWIGGSNNWDYMTNAWGTSTNGNY